MEDTAPPSAAPAAAPAAPAAPPAQPAAPAPSMPVPAPQSKDALKGSFDELDGLATAKPQDSRKAASTPAPDEDEPAEPEKAAQTPEHSDLESAVRPKGQQQQPQSKVASLRTAYEKTKSEVETLRKQLLERETALNMTKKEFDEFKSKPSAIQPELEAVKKRNGELEEAIRFADYRRSKEYEDKYQKPIQQAYTAALEDVGQIQIEGEDRKATDKDFYELLQMSTADAARKAAELFGAASPIVLQHRSAVLRASGQRTKAEAEFKASAKQREEQFNARAESVFNTYKSTISEMSEKFPELFKYDPAKSKDEAEAFEAGAKLADTAFLGFGDNADPDTPIKVARVQGAVRMRAAALVPTLIKLRRAEEEIKGLKEKLGAYEKSEPKGSPASHGGGEQSQSWQQEIDALAAPAGR